jgi:hypothetical protein
VSDLGARQARVALHLGLEERAGARGRNRVDPVSGELESVALMRDQHAHGGGGQPHDGGRLVDRPAVAVDQLPRAVATLHTGVAATAGVLAASAPGDGLVSIYALDARIAATLHAFGVHALAADRPSPPPDRRGPGQAARTRHPPCGRFVFGTL